MLSFERFKVSSSSSLKIFSNPRGQSVRSVNKWEGGGGRWWLATGSGPVQPAFQRDQFRQRVFGGGNTVATQL